jgi:glycosyltransferase involved in cell wall biosynthesis
MPRHSIIVGINSTGYNEKRNIIVPRPDNVEIRKMLDFMKVVDYAYFKIRKKNHVFFHNVYWDAGLKKADIFHFYNAISIGKRPWFVTYENDVPRHNPGSGYLFNKLLAPSCKKIFAMTKNAYNIESYYLDRHAKIKDKVLEKIMILPPPQALYTEEKKQVGGDKIVFTFVGGTFFHKGGKELLQAFIRALQDFKNIHLNIVSSMAFTYWYDTEYTAKDNDEMVMLMRRYPESITHYPSLSNEAIIELFKNSHVGLLPSYGETYGYVVLEAQACGCPVITTNGWGFPEFNSNEKGWLLSLPTITERGGLKFDVSTPAKKKIFSKLLEDRLYETICEICSDPEQITEKSAHAIRNIIENHSVDRHRATLSAFYEAALG